MSTFSFPLPAIVHHMAALDGQTAPPNSLEAVEACLDAGASVIEVDITALAQDDYLLVHDSTLESETTGQGPVDGLTPKQARGLFLKQEHAPTSCHVALLRDLVQLFTQHPGSSRMQLDFKNVFPMPDDEPLHRLIQIIEPLGERVIVTSGADWQLRKLRRIAPWVTLGFDIMFYLDWQTDGEMRDPRLFPKQLGAYGYYDDHPLAMATLWSKADYLRDRCESLMGLVSNVSAFYVNHTLLIQSLADGFNWAEVLHERGIKLDVWTMDTTNPAALANVPPLLDTGVDLFTTNTPRALASVFVKRSSTRENARAE